MEYRSLGRTGVQVTSLCLGCMMFGRRTGADDSTAIIDRALEAGINFFDTANVYARGQSEEITGTALKSNGKRQRVVLATKVHGRMADDDPNAYGRIERELVPMAQTFGIGLIPWSPIAGGLLTGKYRRGEPPPAGSRFSDPNTPGRERRLVDGMYDVVEELERIAQSRDCTLVQLALAWVMSQPRITSPIVGPRTMEQLEEYFGPHPYRVL